MALTGQAITFAGSASAVEPGDTVASYQWTFDEGAVAPPGATAVHSFTRAGLHTATLTATDVLGVQTLVPVQVRVLAPVPVPVPVCNVAVCCLRGLCPRPTLPRITALTLSPSRFRALRTRASVVPVGKSGGALVTFTLSRKALVEFTPERAARGVRRGRRCVAAAHGAHGRRCTRLIPLRSFSRRATAGTHSFRFSGDLAGQALPPGHYELLAGVPGSSLSAPFTIVR